MTFSTTTVSQHCLLEHSMKNSKGGSRENKTETQTSQDAHGHLGKPALEKFPSLCPPRSWLLFSLSQEGSPRTCYNVLHGNVIRNSLPGWLAPALPCQSCQHCIYSHRHFPALTLSPDSQRHGSNTSIKTSPWSVTDVSQVNQDGCHSGLGNVGLLVLFV